MRRVNLVVTCTKRKRLRPSQLMRLRDIEAADLPSAFAEWVDRLDKSDDETTTARELYAGDHWSVVQSLECAAHSSEIDLKTWVCSAGYGLVGIDAKLKAYSATFSPQHPDSVLRWNPARARSETKELWWELHQKWRGPDPSRPRSISALAESDPGTPLLIAASQEYLRAIGNDVRKASLQLRSTDSLIIISTGTKRLPDLESNLLPSCARMQTTVGGSLHSLNARLARRILTECSHRELRASELTDRLRLWLQVAPETRRTVRKRLTDVEVRKFIADSLYEDESATWSKLLRRLRDSGRACRQERFACIFRCEKSKLAGNN